MFIDVPLRDPMSGSDGLRSSPGPLLGKLLAWLGLPAGHSDEPVGRRVVVDHFACVAIAQFDEFEVRP
jgi:hypothetical protein